MKIAILCPTVWEIRKLIAALDLEKLDRFSYRGSVAGHSVQVLLTGVGKENARRSAEKFIGGGSDLVIATGFAGALREGLGAGDLVLDGSRSDPAISKKVLEICWAKGFHLHEGDFLCLDAPLLTGARKIAAGKQSGAVAVEMESDGTWAALGEKNARLLFLRAISDAADQDLPSCVLDLGSGGKVGFKFIKSLLSRPGEWPGFFDLAGSSKKAERNLCDILKEILNHAQEL